MRAFHYRESNPSRGDDAPKLTVRKEGDFSIKLSKVRYEPVGTIGDLSRRFTPRATIAEDVPVGAALADVLRAPTFVITIVPFGEVWFDFSALTQSNQSASHLCPLTWAAEHMDEFCAAQSFSKLARFLFAMFGQRNVCATGVLVG
jgi:hypothetical protein